MQHVRILASFFQQDCHSAQNTLMSDINISQGSVVTRLRYGGIFNNSFIANFQKILKVKKMEIGWYLMKLCLKYCRLFLSGHGVCIIVLCYRCYVLFKKLHVN